MKNNNNNNIFQYQRGILFKLHRYVWWKLRTTIILFILNTDSNYYYLLRFSSVCSSSTGYRVRGPCMCQTTAMPLATPPDVIAAECLAQNLQEATADALASTPPSSHWTTHTLPSRIDRRCLVTRTTRNACASSIASPPPARRSTRTWPTGRHPVWKGCFPTWGVTTGTSRHWDSASTEVSSTFSEVSSEGIYHGWTSCFPSMMPWTERCCDMHGNQALS